MADRADLTARLARHHLAHGDRQLRGREQRVLPLRHRRRAGVVGEAGDGHVVLVNRHDPFDDADRDGRFLEVAALFDVQLDVAVDRALRPPRVEDAIGIAADLPDRVSPPHPVPDLVQIRRLEIAGDDAAAGEGAAEGDPLLVRPDDHLQRMTRSHPGGRQRVDRLDRAERRQRAEVAVEVSAARHRVDVRSEENRRQRRLRSRPPAEDVAARIDARLEAGRLHQADHVPAPLDVGVRVRDAAHAVGEHAAGRTAEDAQRLEPLAQRPGIDARDVERGGSAYAKRARDRRRREAAQKRSAGDHDEEFI